MDRQYLIGQAPRHAARPTQYHHHHGANTLMTEIHNAPEDLAILAADQLDTWLRRSADNARAAPAQYPADLTAAHPVSSRVNSPRNNSAALLEATLQ